ncbi:2-oxoacid:acceptor oxidoreductase subunit alpha [Fusibacter bizertensis]|uniref:2-oxoacid:acceptor oxidoreductase subunit alpha n=1 Tax=Fusibacter bizertensis TaxID=1488331 RepID=A0ABT6NE17_9FIRM|nr:2-oxoacid:acceptor oxidoreductase subunit alpha [Fusibacter bizertensis]MDH8678679.1 2-oxoacid:acceptor oxidoreductase subunit alpha [Fusibacter bizertensis]
MKQELTIVLSGEAGQGLATLEDFLVKAISKTYYVFATTEVMSRVRGGNNSLEIRISNTPVYAYKEHIDFLYLLNNHSLYRLTDRVDSNSKVFGEVDFITHEEHEQLSSQFIPLALTDSAKSAGNVLFSNTVLFGQIAGILNLNVEDCHTLISERFSTKNETIQLGNIKAFDIGFEIGMPYQSEHKLVPQKTGHMKIFTGAEAIGIGSLGGGCNFIASYPMSPGTGVLTYLASKSNAFGVFVEQAEDEIAALNMAIGAWYAGARALVTTSGGGFALMEEAVSLSGITETPCVTHIGQRPGPGTGLPTRTGQEDLNLVVYAGHGEFPRLIYAPGTMEDAIVLSQKAFYMADKYQIPTFILSDQFLLDSKFQMAPFEMDGKYLESFVVESETNYQRYKLTENGVSPRAIPGNGKGLVKCDSDEHTEDGLITESFDVRVQMNDKRNSKMPLLLDDYEMPELIGPANYTNLIVGWGSTYGVLKEYIDYGDSNDTAYLYIKQPFPLHPDIKKYFDQAKHIIGVENNVTAQFARLLKLELDIKVTDHLLKYNGVPFSIEEITNYMKEVL